ncbi:MAG: signal peptidase I [Ruminococcaceae bacterium]|nr:signal peptidase I [Oscillospiraceae bacterium]
MSENLKAKDSILKKTVSIIKKVLLCASIVLCAFLLVLTSWLAIDKFIRKSTVPSFCGYSMLVVASPSMSDTIAKGDIIIIKDTGDYITGDIITFAHEGETIPTTHRIVEYAENGGYVTKGDANDSDDREIVTDDMIFGEVVLQMHVLGLLCGWLIEGGGYIYVLTAIVILGLGIFLIKDDKNRHIHLEANENEEEKAE